MKFGFKDSEGFKVLRFDGLTQVREFLKHFQEKRLTAVNITIILLFLNDQKFLIWTSILDSKFVTPSAPLRRIFGLIVFIRFVRTFLTNIAHPPEGSLFRT